MSLKLMYITNDPEVALIAQNVGVDRIFVDLEYIGKDLRQGGMDTVQSKHTLDDVKRIADVLTSSELLVRVNPIHNESNEYCSSAQEIDTAIRNGAQILMLPYFKTLEEAKEFISLVNGRAKTMLLIETPEAAEMIDEILTLDGVDELYIGLNDLSLGYGKKFMFELLSDGTVEYLANKIKARGIPYGFGGLASLDGGLIPGSMILKEHYRLGSTRVILSRSFCDVSKQKDICEIRSTFDNGVSELRKCELEVDATDFEKNREDICRLIKIIIGE